MKIVAISDLHGNLIENIESCDVLLIAGDISPTRDHSFSYQKYWFEHTFLYWLESLVQCKNILFIAGNHDWYFEKLHRNIELENEFKDKLPDNCHYLIDESVIIDDKYFYGTPWQPMFCDWAFNQDEGQLAGHFSKIPEGLDVLISHGPPKGLNDGDLGSISLRNAVLNKAPRYVVCGHIHFGDHNFQTVESNGKLIQCANVSILDDNYEVVYPPLMFTI